MTRTRATFYVVLFIFLLLVALSVVTQLLTSGTLLQLYIATAIFGLGVTALDFLGIFGEQGEEGADAFDAADGHLEGSSDGNFDIDLDLDSGSESGIDSFTDGPGSHIAGTEFDSGDVTSGHTTGDGAYTRKSAGHRALMLLAYLRLTVYFSVGFGPTGWVALSTGRSALSSLLWAFAAGLLSLALAQIFFRFQQSSTDSTLQSQDLLRQEAIVTIPLSHNEMGKVRIRVGMNVTEQYALASRPDLNFKSGDKVYVTRVTDECVYVA